MTLYLGKKAVCPTKIVTKKVAKTKLGMSIDNLIGDVDENGEYVRPTEEFLVDLSGVKKITHRTTNYNGFSSAFYGVEACLGIVANDITEISGRQAFYQALNQCTNAVVAEFNGIETITGHSAFASFNAYGSTKIVPHFNKLKTILSFSDCFKSAFSYAKIEPDETFPVLEYISGGAAMDGFRKFEDDVIIVFSSVKTIIGHTSKYSSTFGSNYVKNTVWKFPRATEFTDYIWNMSSSYPGEIHFAVANQTAIEACKGYDYKWGFQSATIYFDLMLFITVNGVVYAREYTIGGYTSWKDTDGNIVYTDATVEPTVGTVVYSDKGTAQVGTVEGAA